MFRLYYSNWKQNVKTSLAKTILSGSYLDSEIEVYVHWNPDEAMICGDLTGACCFRKNKKGNRETQVQLTGRTWRKDCREADHGDGRLSQRCCRWCGCTRRRKSIIRRSSLHAEDDVVLLSWNSLRRWRTAAVSRRRELVVVDLRLRKRTIRIFSKCPRKKQRHGE
jgi:hypothetical protein